MRIALHLRQCVPTQDDHLTLGPNPQATSARTHTHVRTMLSDNQSRKSLHPITNHHHSQQWPCPVLATLPQMMIAPSSSWGNVWFVASTLPSCESHSGSTSTQHCQHTSIIHVNTQSTRGHKDTQHNHAHSVSSCFRILSACSMICRRCSC